MTQSIKEILGSVSVVAHKQRHPRYRHPRSDKQVMHEVMQLAVARAKRLAAMAEDAERLSAERKKRGG